MLLLCRLFEFRPHTTMVESS